MEACGLGEFAGWGIFVEGGDAAWGVDDEDPFGACGVEGLVEGGDEFFDACGGGFAPVIVPHVADDDGGSGGVPVFGAGGEGGSAEGRGGTGLEVEGEVWGGGVFWEGCGACAEERDGGECEEVFGEGAVHRGQRAMV